MTDGIYYGYARVSSREQNEERQLFALLEGGVQQKNIYIDRQTGKDFNRVQYRQLLKKMKPGDTLFVKSIDRFGRNYEEIIAQWRTLTKERKVSIVVLDIPLLDTRPSDRDLTGIFIADLVLQILSYVAQTEREFIRQRQAEGIVAARARGVQFGRPAKELPDDFAKLVYKWERGKLPLQSLLDQTGMKESTFYRHLRDLRLVRNKGLLQA